MTIARIGWKLKGFKVKGQGTRVGLYTLQRAVSIDWWLQQQVTV